MIDPNTAASYGLTREQATMVSLVERRFGRDAIAAYLGVSAETVRDVVGGMCDYYGCPTADLPDRVLRATPAENS